MNTEEIYALLVETNPVPDQHRSVDAADVSLRLVNERSTAVQTIEREPDQVSGEPRYRRTWLTAAAAAIVIVGVGALAMFVTGDDEPVGPVDEPAPTATLPDAVPDGVDASTAAAAAAAAAELYGAVQDGDIDVAVEMSNPLSNLTADRAMWEMNAYLADNDLGGQIGECRALEAESQGVIAACDLTVTNPVWTTLGFTDLLLPIRYNADGTVSWQPYLAPDGGDIDFSDANQAVVEYLREFHLDEYERACSPNAYEARSVVNASGLALTRECAQIWVPLVDDIAAWMVESGFGT